MISNFVDIFLTKNFHLTELQVDKEIARVPPVYWSVFSEWYEASYAPDYHEVANLVQRNQNSGDFGQHRWGVGDERGNAALLQCQYSCGISQGKGKKKASVWCADLVIIGLFCKTIKK